VIVVDPGHSGRPIHSRTVNGLLDFDYPNQPEMSEVFDVSACLAEGLRADGYRVIMTKKRVNDSVSLTERARIADRARADLAVSVHDDHSRSPSFQATYSQRGVAVNGSYPTMYRGAGSRRTIFDQPKIAKASDHAARIIARERTRAQGRTVAVRQNSFDGRAPLEPGNLAMVQLLSHVPWVYNEMGARTGASTTRRLGLAAETAYAKGLLDGVEAAVPIDGSTGPPTSTAELRSCLQTRG
jgi:N-acetylmuramoyl-L-alanine amidase